MSCISLAAFMIVSSQKKVCYKKTSVQNLHQSPCAILFRDIDNHRSLSDTVLLSTVVCQKYGDSGHNWVDVNTKHMEMMIVVV